MRRFSNERSIWEWCWKMRVEVIERLRFVAPLAIRFWDVAIDREITTGLHVTARPENHARPLVSAERTKSGLYAFHHLPGLREIENADQDWQTHAPIGETKNFVIGVVDKGNRFLPVAFTVAAPVVGIFPVDTGSPPGLPGFDLFSHTRRQTPVGLAALYAELWDDDHNAPAANAVLIITINGAQPHLGLSNADGKVAVFFPYPPVTVALSGSPLIGTRIALSEQTWEVDVRIRYEPDTVAGFVGVSEPNLRTVFEQGNGVFYSSAGSAGVDELNEEIVFGRPTILRTSGDSKLWVSADSSP